MIVVADTSPINYLVRSGYARILPELFGTVLVPNAVMAELMHSQAPLEVRLFAQQPPEWLKCAETTGLNVAVSGVLGDGEREAIALALKLHADALLIDDLAGRREAESRNIPARGTLAVLLQAGLRGLLNFPAALQTLISLGFRVSRSLEKSLLETYDRENCTSDEAK